MKKLIIRTVFYLFLFSVHFISQGQNFIHPGAMHTKEDLDFIKSKVIANKQPWKGAFDNLVASKFAKLNYSYKTFTDVKCGSYNNPNVGCNDMVENAIAAYTMALRFYISGDKQYAAKAIEIVDAWALKYRSNSESNSRLIVAWSAPWYVNTAEILRYTENSGWTDTHTQNLNDMLNRFKSYIFWEEKPANNWMMSTIEARIAIAIFQDDKKAFDDAIEKWRYRITTYIYQEADGEIPILPTGYAWANIKGAWYSGSSNLKFVDGLCMETCRDMNHTKMGFQSVVYGAEMAWSQGIDLFRDESKRMADFLELHGNWMLGGEIPSNICDGSIDFKGTKLESQAPFDLAYNHLHDRLGMDLPNTLKMIENKRPNTASRWVNKWESLLMQKGHLIMAQMFQKLMNLATFQLVVWLLQNGKILNGTVPEAGKPLM